MTNGSWLKTYRIQIAVHSLILGIFAIYCIFLAEPLWDTLERIPNESKLQEMSLPQVTNNIQCSVGHFVVTTQSLEISGWAFIREKDTKDSETFVVLKSDNKTYIFDSVRQNRKDVTNALKKLKLDLDWSGFWSIIPLRMIESGDYKVGVYIKKGDIEALQYTNKSVKK